MIRNLSTISESITLAPILMAVMTIGSRLLTVDWHLSEVPTWSYIYVLMVFLILYLLRNLISIDRKSLKYWQRGLISGLIYSYFYTLLFQVPDDILSGRVPDLDIVYVLGIFLANSTVVALVFSYFNFRGGCKEKERAENLDK